MGAADDEDDVRKVLAGDVAAFENIVRRWQGPLVNMAYRFCGDRGRAEDMAQEAFLRSFRALGSWRKDAAFSTWLFALAANLYRSELRRLPPRTLSLDDVAEPQGPRRMDVDLEDEYRSRAVRRSVFSLPAKYREVVVLFYFHDQDVPATARTLGLPEGTVKARLFRGRELLREKLGKEMA